MLCIAVSCFWLFGDKLSQGKFLARPAPPCITRGDLSGLSKKALNLSSSTLW